jgi:predicted Rossmann fold nucleotide-binding protein DprA/Smf involved in DNA uptake
VALGVDDVVSAVAGHEVVSRAAACEPAAGDAARESCDPGIAGAAAGDRVLLSALDLVPREVDDIAQATGREIADVLSGLMRLELAGLVETIAGGRVRWTPRTARKRAPR